MTHRRLLHYAMENLGEQINSLGLWQKMESTNPRVSQGFLGF